MNKDIVPFSKFWYDCFVNNRISFLNTINSTYQNMMYINDYKYISYNFEETEDDYLAIKFLQSNSSKDMLSNLNVTNYDYVNSFSFMDDIREMVVNGVIVCPKVDLFIWNKWGKGYHEWKSYHYTMLTGYCSKKNEYTALEDDKYGKYGIIRQSGEDLNEAIKSVKKWCDKSPDYMIFNCDENIPDYIFNIKDLIKNIEQINTSIKDILANKFFCFKEEIKQIPKNMEFQAISISKIVTKMEVNRIFIKILYHEKIINKEAYIKAEKVFFELRNSYEVIKNILLKCRTKKLNEFINQEGRWLNLKLKRNLNYEYEIWNDIKNAINTMDNKKIF